MAVCSLEELRSVCVVLSRRCLYDVSWVKSENDQGITYALLVLRGGGGAPDF